MIPFKVGDWIIAINPMDYSSSESPHPMLPSGGKDYGYTNEPCKIKHIGIAHAVVERFNGADKIESTVLLSEFQERGFIIADEYIVNSHIQKHDKLMEFKRKYCMEKAKGG